MLIQVLSDDYEFGPKSTTAPQSAEARVRSKSNDVIHHRHFIHIRQIATRQRVSFCWQYNFV